MCYCLNVQFQGQRVNVFLTFPCVLHAPKSYLLWRRYFNACNIYSTICYHDFISYLSCVNLQAFKQEAIIFLDNIPFCLNYNIKMNLNMFSFRHNYLFILLFLLLATSFGLNKPTSKLFIISFHSAICLTTCPKPLPKRALHILRSRASSFKWEYPLLSLRSSSSFLRLLPRLPVTSFPLLSFLQ